MNEPEAVELESPSATRVAALAWAEAARAKRTETLDALQSGSLTLADLFGVAQVDDLVGAIKVLTALESLPSARKTDTRRMLAKLAINGRTRLGELTGAQISELSQTFPLVASVASAPLESGA